jgi:hypothetical protein
MQSFVGFLRGPNHILRFLCRTYLGVGRKPYNHWLAPFKNLKHIGEKMRTIIDILRKGNQELFHSSLIAWLIDPKAEHGLNSQFIEKLAEILLNKGVPELKNALSSRSLSVKTETTSYNSRYDIEIKIGDRVFVLENKTKSIGDMPQFKKYDSINTFLIALGFSDVSFSSEVTSKYPLITYKDIFNILNQIAIKKRQ